jgi:tetratricopeptide (TPR) repeat protein
MELGMHQHALECLDKLGDPNQQDGHAAYLRGEALRSLDRHAEALVHFHHAADSNPDDIHILLAMGWCYKRTGRLGLAIYALEQAQEIEPGDALIHYNLACYWSLAGNKERALPYLSTAFDIDSSYRDLVDDEPDFDPIRDEPDFQALLTVIV